MNEKYKLTSQLRSDTEHPINGHSSASNDLEFDARALDANYNQVQPLHDDDETPVKELDLSLGESNESDGVQLLTSSSQYNKCFRSSPGTLQIRGRQSSVNININGGSTNIIVNNGHSSFCPPKDGYRDMCTHQPVSTQETLKIKKGVVSNEVALQVAQKVGASWKRLGNHLGMEPNELDVLRHDHSIDGAEEICYRMIIQWIQMKSSEATHVRLGDALQKMRKYHVVKECLMAHPAQ